MAESSDPSMVWSDVLARLSNQIPRDHHRTFLQPTVGVEWEEGDLIVAAPDSFTVSWLTLPLHLAMAEEALTQTLDRNQNQRIVYRVMPESVPLSVPEPTPQASAGEPSPGAIQCPQHPEAYLRRRTKLPSLVRAAERMGDEVYYCVGDSGCCTWTHSVRKGTFIPAGIATQTPVQVLRAYLAADDDRQLQTVR